jgi:hypothetical protein
MPLTDLKFKPGINKETTPYSEDNGWVNCDKIRFRFGFPEKLNGWEKNSNNAFLGQCRGLNEWVSNNGTHYLGLGTEVKFYVKEGTAFNESPLLGRQHLRGTSSLPVLHITPTLQQLHL